MGHYYSEMMCQKCGDVRCKCPRVEPAANLNWMVDEGFTLITVDEHDKKYATFKHRYGTSSGMPLLRRMGAKQFATRAEAEVHARELCEAAVESAKEKLYDMKALLKVKPWAKQ